MTAAPIATLITGTVAGFVLVIDPDNSEGRFERIPFSDAVEMNARINNLRRAESPDNPVEKAFFTLYHRNDAGDSEAQEGYDQSGATKVGEAAYRMRCRCGRIAWSIFQEGKLEPTDGYVCEDCLVRGIFSES